MKYLSIPGLVCVSICLTVNCGPSPVKKWKKSFDAVIEKLAAVPVTEEGDPADFKNFYAVSEELSAISQDSEYAADLLKDILITSEYIPVRAGAAMTLGRIGTRNDAYALIHALSDSSSFVKHKAHKALKKLTREEFGQDKRAWLEWWNNLKKKEAEHDE
jgi:hypothetical protein